MTVKEYMQHILTEEPNDNCLVCKTLEILNGKWRIRIIYELCREPSRRFGEMKKAVPQITNTMLTSTLRDLEELGIVHREQYNEIPPHVEYSPTKKGRGLWPVFCEIAKWGEELTKMKIKNTNGENEDFIRLVEELDKEFYELLGADQNQFNGFNTLEDIHDVVLVYDGETAVACGGFKRYTGETAEVKRIYVKKEYRKKGVAGKVLQALEEKGKKRGYQYFILETSKKQLPALALYKSIHYEQIDRYPPYEKIELSVCMQKQIR